jgi:hypothetical protein
MIPAPNDEECLCWYMVETSSRGLLKIFRFLEWKEDDEDDDDGPIHSHTLSFNVYKLDNKRKR